MITAIILSLVMTALPSRSVDLAGSIDDIEPTNCEMNAASLAVVKGKWAETSANNIVIVIARLGRSESSESLNDRRLYNVTYYLKARLGVEPKKIVQARGKKGGKYGAVELYVKGELVDVLVAENNKDLCVACCGPDADFYPEREKQRNRKRTAVKHWKPHFQKRAVNRSKEVG
jgi:hypothetical protein